MSRRSTSPSGIAPTLAPVLLALLAACGGADDAGRAPPREPVEIVVDVRIDPAAVALDAGETIALAALVTTETVEPGAVAQAGPAVTWAAAPAHVATVAADGTVTAVGTGIARVSATAGGVTGEAVVTVSEPGGPPPAGVDRVEPSSAALTLAEGATATLSATPRDASGGEVTGLPVRWTTSDEGVVSVTAAGELRAIRAGAADVPATVHGKAATARVTATLETAFDLFFETWSAVESRFDWMTRDLRDPAAASQLLMAGGDTSGSPVPSPAGDRVAFTLSSPLSPRNQLRVVNLQRETVWFAELPGEAIDAAWSWDGAWLAYALRSAETGFDVWVVRADGTGAVNLTASLGPGSDTQPTWAPASIGKLAFTRTVGGEANVWTVDADGANPARLTAGGADAEPAWSPDGTSIAFQRSGAAIFGDLYLVSPTGAVQRSLHGLPGIQSRPAWSPDGALVAFTSGGDVHTFRPSDGAVARRTFDGGVTLELRPGWIRPGSGRGPHGRGGGAAGTRAGRAGHGRPRRAAAASSASMIRSGGDGFGRWASNPAASASARSCGCAYPVSATA
jgi:hypothetical protein